ncbi:MAG TPA: DNA-protecting protein DprA [Bacteroidales bacterium]|nr:DNA-protecting protein DprA [Bacteroidales bacterium]
MNDLLYKIALSLIDEVGSVTARKLLSYIGDPCEVFKAKERDLLQVPGIGTYVAEKILSTRDEAIRLAEKELEFISSKNIEVLYFLDEKYPDKLNHCEDAPVILYSKGNAGFNHRKILSVVGTREATDYGRKCCRDLIKDLAANHPGLLIVSGLAYGIDIAAHQAALENKLETVAVLGHGLHMIYPTLHSKAAAEIMEHGALLTEFSSSSTNDKSNFARRNRIVAGMADATVVIESGLKGGSLITADIAMSYNRDVFAFPGKAGDQHSSGCNWLIKTNKAALAESFADIEYQLGWQTGKKKKADPQRALFIELSETEQRIITLLNSEKLSIDMISIKMDMPVSKISPVLLELEFKNLIKNLPGNIYAII